jgi:integrase
MIAPMGTKKKQAEIINNGGFTVRLSEDVTKDRQGWRLTWNNPKRQRKFFANYDEAKEQARRISGDLRQGRTAAANADASDLDELSRARRNLLGIDTSIDQAVKEYAECYRALGGRSVAGFVHMNLGRMGKLKESTILETAKEYIAEKEARGKGRNYTKTLKKDLLYGFAAKIRKPILEVTVDDLNSHLSKWGGRTRNNKINSIVSLFNYARGKYLPDGEPTAAHRLQKDTITPKEVEIWTPEEARTVLRHAKPDELGFFALAIFSGIRTEELQKMDWAQVRPHKDPDESHIEVRASDSKMRLGRRIVPILPPLAAYLKKIGKPKAGKIVPNQNMNNRMIPLAKRAGMPWKKNACRHSFGSYRMADIKNVFQVAEEMGNSPAMVKKHYFQAVTKAEAAKFWAIRPD